MDFTALKAEIAAAGFARLTDAQLGSFANRGMHELDELDNWPYREASVTGVAPLAIADLGEVDQVFNMSTTPAVPLDKRSYRELVNDFGDLDSAGGAPWFWYRASPAGVPTVATYPESGVTVGVQYWKVADDLVSGSDEPSAPARFHGLVALIGKRMAHAEKGDRATAESIQVEVDRWVARMRVALLPDDGMVGQIIAGESADW